MIHLDMNPGLASKPMRFPVPMTPGKDNLASPLRTAVG